MIFGEKIVQNAEEYINRHKSDRPCADQKNKTPAVAGVFPMGECSPSLSTLARGDLQLLTLCKAVGDRAYICTNECAVITFKPRLDIYLGRCGLHRPLTAFRQVGNR